MCCAHEGGRTQYGAGYRTSATYLRVYRAWALGGLALVLGLRADEDRDLAQVLVFEHQLVCFGDALEAERAPQHRPDLTGLDQLVGLHALVGVGEVRAED